MHSNPKLHKIPLIAQQSKTKDKRREKKKQKAPEPTLKQTKGQGVAHKSLTYVLAGNLKERAHLEANQGTGGSLQKLDLLTDSRIPMSGRKQRSTPAFGTKLNQAEPRPEPS